MLEEGATFILLRNEEGESSWGAADILWMCVCARNTRQRERERAKTEFLYIAYFTVSSYKESWFKY